MWRNTNIGGGIGHAAAVVGDTNCCEEFRRGGGV